MKQKNKDFFLEQFTDFIFLEDEMLPSDVIFVPGNRYPYMAEKAAELYHRHLAPWILPSGHYSILVGRFEGALVKTDIYPGPYETEGDFLTDVLQKAGVPREAILTETEATYTYQNAIFSRQLLDERNIKVKRAIICCQSHHARRCKLYYQLLFPEAELLMCPVDTVVGRDTWQQSEQGIDTVLGELERCGAQFHQIFREHYLDK